jgi:hypothetical protein
MKAIGVYVQTGILRWRLYGLWSSWLQPAFTAELLLHLLASTLKMEAALVLWKVGIHLQDYMALQPGTPQDQAYV